MNRLIEKLETDVAARVLAGKILSSILGLVSIAAAVATVYLSWSL
jgi:hypothetical protein